MADLIDLGLLKESRTLLQSLIQKRGLTWFLAKEGRQPLFAIEASSVNLVVKTAAQKMARAGRTTHPKAVEYVRTEIRRELIRRVTEAMLRVGY